VLYRWIKPLLFKLDPETAHDLSLACFNGLRRLGLAPRAGTGARQESVQVMGLNFGNRIGLAAGLDKDGDHIDALAGLGFGFIEIGTVTPRPQPGNPKPRMFRLTDQEAIINRMGFNNKGVDALVENVKRARYRGVLGINIGKNFDTPIERAAEDYVACLRKVYPYAGYVTANISSPNTESLRDLQQAPELDALLGALTAERARLAEEHRRTVPLVVKIAPDLESGQIDAIARLLTKHALDGVIATNTTVSREGVQNERLAREPGGLSGAPLRAQSTHVIAQLAQRLAGRVPIIGVGGIMNGQDAAEKIAAGASLVQIYTGLVYRGPELVSEVRSQLLHAAPG
jgi:dihydroorotate dehydrogenase